MLIGVLPNWVEADPLRSRATDALGLQVVADRLADRLLPGLSVLTNRARYFTFLCWARNCTGTDHDEHTIHRWEVALALAEAQLSNRDQEHEKDCRFVGSRNAKRYVGHLPPSDPRNVYKVPAWRAYRASMIALGLVQDTPRFGLSDEGKEAARLFRVAVRPQGTPARPLPDSACLSQVSRSERKLLRYLLGISRRGRLDSDAGDARTRRARFAREVRKIFWRDGLSPETVLPRYEEVRARALDEPAATLREAAIWERLSLGLNVIFAVWLRSIEAGRPSTVARDLAKLLSIGTRSAPLAEVDLSDQEAALAKAVSCLRQAVRRRADLADRGVALTGDEWFELACHLVSADHLPRNRAHDTVERLLQKHLEAKGDEAWVRGHGSALELARDPATGWAVPSRVRLHGYRMGAFDNIARDLGGI